MANIKKNNEQEKALSSVVNLIKEIEQINSILDNSKSDTGDSVLYILNTTSGSKKLRFDISVYEKDIINLLSKSKRNLTNSILSVVKKYDIELNEDELKVIGLVKQTLAN